MPLRRPLLLSLLLGVVCLTVARVRALWSRPCTPLSRTCSTVRSRCCATSTRSTRWCGSRSPSGWRSWPPPGGPRRAAGGPGARTIAQALVVVVLLVSAQPLWSGDLRKPGWDAVPDAWSEAAAYLAAQDGTGSTLVLPGAGFGQQGWGWTIDEPIQGLATTPWAARSQVPLTPGGTIRNLDAIQERIADGQGSPDARRPPGARGGRVRPGASRPGHLRQRRTGPRTGGPRRLAQSRAGARGVVRSHRLRRAADDRRLPGGPRRAAGRAIALDDVRTLAGGPEDVLTALESGELDPESPVGDRRRGELAAGHARPGRRRLPQARAVVRPAGGRAGRGDGARRALPRWSAARTTTRASRASQRVYARYDGVARSRPRRRAGTPTRSGPSDPRSGRTPPWTGCPRPTGSPRR